MPGEHKHNLVVLAVAIALTLLAAYWLHPLPPPAVVVLGLVAYGLTWGVDALVRHLTGRRGGDAG